MTKIYQPGDMTDEIVDAFCRVFKEISCKRKIIEEGAHRSRWVERYGVQIFFSKKEKGLIKARFITDDDIEITHNVNIQDFLKDRSLMEAFRHDTIQAINKHRSQRTPYVINSKPEVKELDPPVMQTAINKAIQDGKNVIQTPEITH